jgi:hypothetical protein
MPPMRRTLDLLLSLLFLALFAACVAGLYNVVRDDQDVVELAEAAACEGEGARCTVQRLFYERGPSAETFELLNLRQEVVRVRCARQDVLLGPYVCNVRDRRTYAGGRLVLPRPVPPWPGKGGAARKPAAPPSASVPTPAPVSPGDGGP